MNDELNDEIVKQEEGHISEDELNDYLLEGMEILRKREFENSYFQQKISEIEQKPFELRQRLSEGIIRYAYENTNSNIAAVRLLGVDRRTLKKYASRIIDSETGLSLWEMQKQKPGYKVKRTKPKKPTIRRKYKYKLSEILAGRRVNYDKKSVLKRLIYGGYFPEECQRCGYCEKRVLDDTVPLTISFKDGDRHNFHMDNIEIICLNCFYQYYGDRELTLRDFRTYQTQYSTKVREKIIEYGERKYNKPDVTDISKESK